MHLPAQRFAIEGGTLPPALGAGDNRVDDRQAESLLDAAGFADAGVRAAWESYRDLDVEPPLEGAWFPAWLLLSEPGLAKAWQTPPPDEAGPAGRGFDALRRLVATGGADQQEIALRRELQQSHPGFLLLFLQWQAARRD